MHSLPIDTTIAITYRCDAKCKMCNIWQLNPQEILSVDDYAKIPSSLRDVNVSGGEPFLRKDMIDIVKVVDQKCNHPRIVISSNGFRTNHIVAAMEELRKSIPNIGIGISLDGIGETHDRIRGVKGAFANVMTTLGLLKKKQFTNVRIDFTVQNDNVREMEKVYDLTCSLGFQFTSAVAQNSDIYFSTQANNEVAAGSLSDALGYVIKRELMNSHPKRWARAYFSAGTLVFNKEKRRILKCSAGKEFFYLSPDGIIYPCLTLPYPMGDLKEHTFEEIWASDEAEAVRNRIDGCEKCWMMCGTRTSFKKNAAKVALWIAREKLKTHFEK